MKKNIKYPWKVSVIRIVGFITVDNLIWFIFISASLTFWDNILYDYKNIFDGDISVVGWVE